MAKELPKFVPSNRADKKDAKRATSNRSKEYKQREREAVERMIAMVRNRGGNPDAVAAKPVAPKPTPVVATPELEKQQEIVDAYLAELAKAPKRKYEEDEE